ncbi:hypothetical protein BJ165DRAFT_1530871 [Panaeolus papilionaceus]|nr:hypothetical protein BJ165DRAFT_1530871 [Panaeolus papilionaceus]
MTDRHKRKAAEDSSLEAIPPPSTQPPPKKFRTNTAAPNFPSSLRPIFAPGSHSKPAKPATASTSAPKDATNPSVKNAKAKGKAKAEPQVNSEEDHNSDNSDDSDSHADNSNSNFAQTASEFKSFLKSQIKADRGAARKETNNQGGKGPSARGRADPSPASTSPTKTTAGTRAVPRPRALKVSEFRVKVVMILPYGITAAPAGQRNRYNSPFNIRGNAFWSKDIGYLGSKGFSIRASDSDGFVFDDNWSEDRVFREISSLLPEAAEKLNQTHNPVKNGPRKWLPCLKASHGGKFVVSPADGPYTGAVMRNIAISGNQRGGENEGIIIVSTTKIRISNDDDSTDSEDEPTAPSAQSSRLSTTSHKSATSGSSSTQQHHSAPSSTRQLRSRLPKKVEVISITDDDSDTKSFGSLDLQGTEPSYSRAGSPAGDLDQSFSELGVNFEFAHHDVNMHDCQPELPAEADYCWSSS